MYQTPWGRDITTCNHRASDKGSFTSPFFWLFSFTLQPRQGHSRPCIWAAICFRPISRGVLSPALLGPLVLYCPQSSSPEKYLTGTHHQPGPSLNQFLPRYITCWQLAPCWQMALPPKQQKKKKNGNIACTASQTLCLDYTWWSRTRVDPGVQSRGLLHQSILNQQP